jgi:hypothetical protein
MDYFIKMISGPDATELVSWQSSLIVSILSAGTFLGALIAGDLADRMGRKWTVITGCFIYCLGVVIQMITGEGDALAAIVAGRLIAGIGVGFESAIVILYMSEICPRKVRGSLVAGYQFCITIGLLLASCVVYGTQNIDNPNSGMKNPSEARAGIIPGNRGKDGRKLVPPSPQAREQSPRRHASPAPLDGVVPVPVVTRIRS